MTVTTPLVVLGAADATVCEGDSCLVVPPAGDTEARHDSHDSHASHDSAAAIVVQRLDDGDI